MKARLVARGFEEDSEQFKKDSPKCTRDSLRLLFLTASSMKWEINTLDIVAVFLEGNDIQRELYLQPPRGPPKRMFVEAKEIYIWFDRCTKSLV